ncbi:MAG TPA: hypothetical protein VNQ73_20840 [Ilumatobacter sp.]|nr:hypothetical protein [Ilumatobacter sp.]
MGDIVVVYAFLDALEHHARTTAEALDAGSQLMNLEFTGNPDVTTAYADFLGRWDEHRGGLRDGVAAAADALRAVRDAFMCAEDQLIAALGGG